MRMANPRHHIGLDAGLAVYLHASVERQRSRGHRAPPENTRPAQHPSTSCALRHTTDMPVLVGAGLMPVSTRPRCPAAAQGGARRNGDCQEVGGRPGSVYRVLMRWASASIRSPTVFPRPVASMWSSTARECGPRTSRAHHRVPPVLPRPEMQAHDGHTALPRPRPSRRGSARRSTTPVGTKTVHQRRAFTYLLARRVGLDDGSRSVSRRKYQVGAGQNVLSPRS
jgi:hypothetical protein